MTNEIFPPLDVLYEDNHIIAINKRSSDIVQTDWTEDTPLLERVRKYIEVKHKKPGKAFVGVVHRIDRPVSGVLLFGKTTKGVARLSELFKERLIKKTYWAVVKDKPLIESATLVHWLKKNSERNKSYAFEEEMRDSNRCVLDYRVAARSKNYYLLEVKPLTGRHHQIRVQLSYINSPIKGDVKYGYDRPNEGGSIYLHARQIEFIHPVSKKEIKIIAPVPNDTLWKYFEAEMTKTTNPETAQKALPDNVPEVKGVDDDETIE